MVAKAQNVSFATLSPAPSTGPGKNHSIILDSLSLTPHIWSGLYLKNTSRIQPLYTIFLLRDNSPWIFYSSAHLTREDTASFCSGLSFQGDLCSKEPWKIVIASPLKQRTGLFASQNNKHHIGNVAKESKGQARLLADHQIGVS